MISDPDFNVAQPIHIKKCDVIARQCFCIIHFNLPMKERRYCMSIASNIDFRLGNKKYIR